jgi:hypothetical protein
MKVRDVVSASMNQVRFEGLVDRLRDAADRQITGKPSKVVEVVAKRYLWNDDEKESVMTHLIKGGDLSQYGLLNAVTRASQDVADYDRATDFERFGGEIMELPKTDWSAIAAAN